jgi:heat shock protein HslJ
MAAAPSRLALALAACASGIIAAACASTAPPAESSDLAGTRWTVQSIDGASAGPRAPTIAFAPEDRVSGVAGCNRFFGVYEAQAGHIDVRALGRTEMACDQPVMRVEEEFLDMLDEADNYRRDAERLVITAENGRSLVLTQASGQTL